jgi:hypothetical protein
MALPRLFARARTMSARFAGSSDMLPPGLFCFGCAEFGVISR